MKKSSDSTICSIARKPTQEEMPYLRGLIEEGRCVEPYRSKTCQDCKYMVVYDTWWEDMELRGRTHYSPPSPKRERWMKALEQARRRER